MNRRWPMVAAWSLLAATAITAATDAGAGHARGFVAALAAATALACLCARRHLQHSLTAASIIMAGLGAVFAPSTSLAQAWPVPLLAFALLVGSRGAIHAMLRRKSEPGLAVLGGTSVLFGLHGLAREWWRDGHRWFAAEVPWWLAVTVVTLAGAVAQLAAAPWLVKTIPEAKQDERPAIALWLVLLVWLLGTPAR